MIKIHFCSFQRKMGREEDIYSCGFSPYKRRRCALLLHFMLSSYLNWPAFSSQAVYRASYGTMSLVGFFSVSNFPARIPFMGMHFSFNLFVRFLHSSYYIFIIKYVLSLFHSLQWMPTIKAVRISKRIYLPAIISIKWAKT